MGWSGGTFSRVHDWTDDESAGLNIEASRMDAEDDNFATGINSCRHIGGQNTATANLPMGGFLHTGVGNGSERNHYASLGQVQDLACIHATSAGTNTITLSLTPLISAYSTGQVINFIAGGTNTGAATLNANSLGAKAVQYQGSALTGYEILSGKVYTVIYNGTNFQLLNPSFEIGCVASTITSQILGAVGGEIQIEFELEDADYSSGAIHSTSVNPERFTVPKTGIYACTCYASFDTAGTDIRILYLNVNGSPKYLSKGVDVVNISGNVYLTAGQYVSFGAQTTLASENVEAARASVHILRY